MLLALVLPLQGAVQLVAGLQGRHHAHVPASQPAAPLGLSWLAPLRAALDHLHTLPDPRLAQGPGLWAQARSLALGEHRHGMLVHRHAAQDDDMRDVGDAGDEGGQGGASVFLLGLPQAVTLPAAAAGAWPAGAVTDWSDHRRAPPLDPPRG